MTFKRALATALLALAALPATAAAQDNIPPPGADNYLESYIFNDEQHPFPASPQGFTADTTSYTTQTDIANPPSAGGPAEPINCGPTNFGNTVWSLFFSNRWGVMRIDTAGPFDGVIGIVEFPSLDNALPDYDTYYCFDTLAGFEEQVKFSAEPYEGIIVRPRQWYAIQVGGTDPSTNTAKGGPVQVKLDFNPPPRLDGDVVLSWTSNGRVAKVKSLVINAPKGSKVSVKCSRNGCGGNPRSFSVKKSGLTQPLGKVGPVAVVNKGSRAKAQAHAAKKFKLLKGRKLKNSSKIEIRITRPGFIGRYFSYSVKKAAVSSKTSRCLNPNSSKPRKKCP